MRYTKLGRTGLHISAITLDCGNFSGIGSAPAFIGKGDNDKGLSRQHILRQVECSLQRLGVDHIDMYMMHEPDPATPLEKAIRAMDDLALAWMLVNPLITSPIIGPRKPAHFQPMKEALALQLTTAERDALTVLFPGL